MRAIEPCPCCGSAADLQDVRLIGGYKAVRVRCGNCGLRTRIVLIDAPALSPGGLDERTRYTREQAADIAIRSWNKRRSKP